MKTITLKRTLTTASFVLCAVILAFQASAAYKIYKVKGDVSIKSKNGKTIKAQRRADVSLTDVVSIPKDGSLEILNSDSHRIYSSVSTGKMSVKSLIDKAEKNAANITRNINKKVMAAVAETGAQKRTGYDAMGMAIHETDFVAGPPVPIPDGMSYLRYLLTDDTDPDAIHQNFLSIKTQSAGDDETFNFAIESFIDKPLYYNIISRNNGDNISFCFPKNHIVAPNSESVVAEYTYLKDNKDKGYVVVASESDFSLDDAKRLLEPEYIPAQMYYLSVITSNQ
ncbi:MAG: hypothetical protein K2J46_07980 [Muribaculaceae bacterium]|nr:hypothetical protein [Muribaculaceae bacterium]